MKWVEKLARASDFGFTGPPSNGEGRRESTSCSVSRSICNNILDYRHFSVVESGIIIIKVHLSAGYDAVNKVKLLRTDEKRQNKIICDKNRTKIRAAMGEKCSNVKVAHGRREEIIIITRYYCCYCYCSRQIIFRQLFLIFSSHVFACCFFSLCLVAPARRAHWQRY